MDDHNPYRASGVAVVRPLERLDIESTAKVRRFFNWLIDKAMTFVVGSATGAAIMVGGDAAATWLEQMGKFSEWLLGVAIYVAYYAFMEGAFGFTIGKLITNTRVVDEYGRPPGFARALLRTLCRLIPFDAFSVLMSDDAVRRGWHDSLARCYVVDRPRGGRPVGTPRRRLHEAFANGVIPPQVPQAPQPAPAE